MAILLPCGWQSRSFLIGCADVDAAGFTVTEGIANKMYRSDRVLLCRGVLQRCMQTFCILIKAPPQSGKTSLLQLL